MVVKLSSWEEAYGSVQSLWGLKPDRTLVEYASLVPEGHILDLGMGEGRNALFFAEMGYEVEGIDSSQTAVQRCTERAKNANLRVEVEVRDLIEADIPQGKYSLIIAAWVLDFFKKAEAGKIIGRIKNGLKRDGLVYVGVFSPDDPGFERAKKDFDMIEENTFYSTRRECFVHYYTKEELLSLFADLRVIYCVEGTGLDLAHGEPHYHGFIEYVGQKCGPRLQETASAAGKRQGPNFAKDSTRTLFR